MVFKEVGKELPEIWKPTDAEDFIEGIYVQKKVNVGENKANLYVIEIEGKLRAVWGCTVLDNAMTDPSIEIGDTLRITYEGVNNKPKYHKYKVEKDFPDEKIVPDPIDDAVEEAESESKTED